MAQKTYPKALLAILLSLNAALAFAQESQEQLRLAAMLRQLELVQHMADEAASRPDNAPSRYTFDYQRLSTDLERVRHGIHDYLTPKRAQPRDPVELLGDYRQQNGNAP